MKGRGAPQLKGSGRGDLLARVKVTVPKLTKAEKEALEGYQKVSRESRGRGCSARELGKSWWLAGAALGIVFVL